jgi:hypothetical protein
MHGFDSLAVRQEVESGDAFPNIAALRARQSGQAKR